MPKFPRFDINLTGLIQRSSGVLETRQPINIACVQFNEWFSAQFYTNRGGGWMS